MAGEVIDAKDRFLGRATPQVAEAHRSHSNAQAELDAAQEWPHFDEEPVKKIIGAVLLASIQHQHMMSLACAYAIAVKLTYGVGHWTPPTPLLPLDK